MKKIMISLVAVIVAATATYAQSSVVATLNHENTISVFHGQTALAQAMAAAEDGDLVTLSSGNFAATDIKKAVTLRGTGIEENEVTGQHMTRIVGDLEFNIGNGTTEKSSVEGVFFDGTVTKNTGKAPNATFNKCQFTTFTCVNVSNYSSYKAENWTFTNCYFTKMLILPYGTSATFVNCCVFNPRAYSRTNNPCSLDFTNCIVIADGTVGFQTNPHLTNSTFTNCFLFQTNTNLTVKALDQFNQAYNCVGYDASGKAPVFGNINQDSNIELNAAEYNALFKADTFYELTDEARTKYIGNDGQSEVGLYGGVLPYNIRILNPQITKCQVAPKTTTDGKLSVNIEVKAAE